MRIAQIAPLMEAVPPRFYGGTERIVSWLTEELVRQGHAVTLVASGDSVTAADLLPCTPQAIRLSDTLRDDLPHTLVMADRVRRLAGAFDVLHFHVDMFHFPLFRGLSHKTLTTLHGRQDIPDLWPFYRAFSEMPLVSISDAQRAPIRDANFAGTVLHGLPADLHRPCYDPRGGYLAFLGRIAPEKRPDPRGPDRPRARHPVEDRRQGGRRRPRLLREQAQADVGAGSRRGVRRRGRRARQDPVPR